MNCKDDSEAGGSPAEGTDADDDGAAEGEDGPAGEGGDDVDEDIHQQVQQHRANHEQASSELCKALPDHENPGHDLAMLCLCAYVVPC